MIARRAGILTGILTAGVLVTAGAATAASGYDRQQDAKIAAQASQIVELQSARAELEARVSRLEASATPSPTPTPSPIATSAPTPTPSPTPRPSASPTPTPSSAPVTDLAAAIAAAPNGATLRLSGTYTLSRAIVTSKSLTLVGDGTAVITSSSSVRQDYLYITGGPFTVRQVTFRAGSGVFHDSNGSALAEVDGGHDVLFDGVTFIGHPNLDDHQQLLYQRLGVRVTVDNSTFVANGSRGFGFHQYPGSSSDPLTVVEDTSFAGFGVSAAITSDSRITVRRDDFRDMRSAIQLRNSAGGSVVTDNHGTNVTTPYDFSVSGVQLSGNVWQ